MEVETSENVGESATKSGKPSRNKLSCSIACLDGANFNINIEKNAPGKLLVDKICSHLKVDEKEYFGLLYVEHKTGLKRWLETYKPIKKQLNGSEPNFEFAVKFFEPNPEQVNNDYTRYLMALQIREEIATGSLPCSFSAQALLGSYVIQSEFGDYDPLQHGQDYLDGLVFAPEQSPELIMKIKELHRSHKGLTPMEADLQYLEYARKLTMYGVDLHEARNVHGADIHVGVSFAGIAIYKDQIRTNKFTW
ncbi:protein 4.1-like [Xenia sp. Carnegie-2017]|uniref:protein 4.1-like n=1 Tax=Xenia sp. Carnegie-2017 TaxID=2897299 RepID=UPI001F04FD97|nr:protein 4.1-like [Xenia sp. Carnegie-2017]